jgi:phosphatidylethanolamine-binding protein (PEBP) family uncharacterized protein
VIVKLREQVRGARVSVKLKELSRTQRSRAVSGKAAKRALRVGACCAAVATIAGCGSQTTSSTSPSAAANTPTTQTAATTTATTATGPTTTSATASSSVARTRARPVTAPVRRASRHRLRQTLSSLSTAKRQHQLTPTQLSKLAIADIALSSPAFGAPGTSATLPREHTCRGADRSPPLRWQGLPANTAELALFVLSVTPVNGQLFFDWAVTGLSPSLTGLKAGQLPVGAILGRNSYGQNAYSICPPAGKNEDYVFTLYALPQKIAASPGFDPATLRTQALQAARHSGLLIATYKPT